MLPGSPSIAPLSSRNTCPKCLSVSAMTSPSSSSGASKIARPWGWLIRARYLQMVRCSGGSKTSFRCCPTFLVLHVRREAGAGLVHRSLTMLMALRNPDAPVVILTTDNQQLCATGVEREIRVNVRSALLRSCGFAALTDVYFRMQSGRTGATERCGAVGRSCFENDLF